MRATRKRQRALKKLDTPEARHCAEVKAWLASLPPPSPEWEKLINDVYRSVGNSADELTSDLLQQAMQCAAIPPVYFGKVEDRGSGFTMCELRRMAGAKDEEE